MKQKNDFDEKVPIALREIQEWFAGIITSRLTPEHTVELVTQSGTSLQEEAKKYIVASHTLEPYERIQIYSQCYWTRILDALHEIFPLVCRLFDYFDFNQTLAIPYLLKHPSTHWDLSMIGSKFVGWMQENYTHNDAPLVVSAAVVDNAFQDSFFAKDLPPIETNQMTPDQMATLMESNLQLQPHLQLLKLPFNMLPYRELFLKEPVEYWADHDFPKVEKDNAPYFFAIFRNLQNKVEWKELSDGEFELLKLIEKGNTLEQACEELEKIGGKIFELAEERIAYWLQEWLIRKWLTTTDK
jgi:hypothetical protein